MRILFDLDHTLCSGKPYEDAWPLEGAKELLERCKLAGHTILIYTARGMGTGDGNVGKAIATIGQVTLDQVSKWGFVYDEFYFGKPAFDIGFDDKVYDVTSPKEIEIILTTKQII